MITCLFTFCLCTNHFLYFLLGPSIWLFQVRPPPFSDSISKTFYLVSILTNDLGNTGWSVFSLSHCFAFICTLYGDYILVILVVLLVVSFLIHKSYPCTVLLAACFCWDLIAHLFKQNYIFQNKTQETCV